MCVDTADLVFALSTPFYFQLYSSQLHINLSDSLRKICFCEEDCKAHTNSYSYFEILKDLKRMRSAKVYNTGGQTAAREPHDVRLAEICWLSSFLHYNSYKR